VTVAPEVKRRSGYDPNQPRDRKGRWVETGADVRNAITNVVGRVVAINKGDSFHETTYDVQMSDGTTQKWETSAVDVVRNRDGSAPSVAKPGTPAAHAETGHGAPSTPGSAPGGTPAATGGLPGAVDAVYLLPSGTGTGTGTPTQADPVGHALSEIDHARSELDIGSEMDLALGDLATTLETFKSGTGQQQDQAVGDLNYALDNLGLDANDPVVTAVRDVLDLHAYGGPPDAPAAKSPLDAAIEQVHDNPVPPPGKVKLSDGSALEGVQVTQLKPGDKIRQRKGTLYWHWVNRPKDENGVPTDKTYPTEGTVVDVVDAGAIQTGAFGSGTGTVHVTLDDGKIIQFTKTQKVDRVIAPVEVAVDDVYEPADGSGPKTPETAGILTKAQQTAIKNKWKLPKGTVAELQAQLAAVQKEPTPSVADLIDQGVSAEEATKKAKKLHVSATDRAWKKRVTLQAAIDTLITEDKAKGPSGPQKAAEQIAKVDLDKPAAIDNTSIETLTTPTVPPNALYATFDATDAGPGAILPGHKWFDVLALTDDKKDTDPIPVSDVSVAGGYVVHQGWAQKIDGKSYLVEIAPDEDAASAAARMQQAAAVQKAVLQHAPPESHAVQRGIALVNGANPHDEHWAKTYGIDDFESAAVSGDGSVTFFGGKAVDPATIAHEFGHNVDSNGMSTSQWTSQLGVPTLEGQSMPWKLAGMFDTRSSEFYKGRFKETRPGMPIVLGEASVTEYGAVDIREDFAESVRLWVKDRRYGKIGYDPTTGDNLRFSDVFPARARVLDAVFATTTDFDTPARKKRQEEFKQRVKKIHLNVLSAQEQPVEDGGHAPVVPWQDPSGNWDFGGEAAKFGLFEEDAITPFEQAGNEANDEHEADKAAKAAHAKMMAEMLAAQEAKQKAAQKSVADFKDALAQGLIDKTQYTKLRMKRYDVAYNLKKKGVPEAEAQAAAAAWEQSYIAEHWPAGAPGAPGAGGVAVPGQPWAGKMMLPDINFPGAYGSNQFISEAGTDKHPKAKKQSGAAGQAKANIMAELASRMNNPEDWEKFRQYQEAKGYYSVPGPFNDHKPAERQKLLDAVINARIADWASSSGDSQTEPVLMQYAAQQEFNLPDAHPAPRMGTAEWKLIQDSATPARMGFLRGMLRHMHDHTQEELKAQGITHVKLYRGMNFYDGPPPEWAKPDGKAKRPRFQPINSWSTHRSTSQGFSTSSPGKGVIFEAAIPIELIVGTARTGFGCRGEFEFVVMDADGLALANDYYGTFKMSEAAAQAKFEADAQQMAGG
jgi:hypothetical protein